MKSISNASPYSMLIYEFIGTSIITFAFVLGYSSPNELRAFAFFIAWVIAYEISGAHFNPATTLAVFIIERHCKNLMGMLFTVLFQLMGAFFGVLISFLLFKDYPLTNNGQHFRLLPLSDTVGQALYNTDGDDPY